jgi:Major Facilitator Superfamily/Cyclic nucleotide-binding domain
MATPDLRRLQLSWVVAAVGGWVVFVALAVYAYRVGGAFAVGAMAVVRMVPAGLAAPFAGVLADRHVRRDVLLGTCLARALSLSAISAAVALSAPFGLVLFLAALFTIAATAHRPAQAALLPSLAQTPAQLTASNAVWSGLDNAAFLVGALLSGGLIATVGMSRVFLLTAVLFALAALPIAGITRDPVPDFRASDDGVHPVRDAIEGYREVSADRGLRLIVGVLSISTVVEGAVDVLVVLLAIDVLGLGGSGVGWLNACWGLGGLVGGALALRRLGRGTLAGGLTLGSLLVGLPLVLIGVIASTAVSVTMLLLLGVGYALIEVAGLSLLQRLPSNDLLGRAFAVVESSYWLTTGIGAMLAPVIVHLLGARGALICVGVLLPTLVVVRWAALAGLEAGVVVPERPFKALRAISLFAPLSLATIENVSRKVDEVQVTAGETVIREGDYGERFYVVAEGLLDVRSEHGAYPSVGAGDYFGEIALLHDVPRTATVTARDDSLLYALDRESFLSAIFAHAATGRTAHHVAAERLARVPTT